MGFQPMRKTLLILTEIVLVMVIIGLLAAMWLPGYIGGNEPADAPVRSRR
jgi:hypothetical protein